MGYTHGDYKNRWNLYGVYTNRKKAETALADFSENVLGQYKWRAKTEPEEYRDMADAYLVCNRFYDKLWLAEDSKDGKHIHLEIYADGLTTGR